MRARAFGAAGHVSQVRQLLRVQHKDGHHEARAAARRRHQARMVVHAQVVAVPHLRVRVCACVRYRMWYPWGEGGGHGIPTLDPSGSLSTSWSGSAAWAAKAVS
jgi:hypothetical protein